MENEEGIIVLILIFVVFLFAFVVTRNKRRNQNVSNTVSKNTINPIPDNSIPMIPIPNIPVPDNTIPNNVPDNTIPVPKRWDTCYDGFYNSSTMINGFCGPNSFLSNFYEYPMTFKGNTFKSSEAAYQAQKFINKPEIYKLFFEASADASKKLATTYYYDKADFAKIRIPVMKEIVSAKFSDPTLRRLLLDTGDKYLIEFNWWGDTFWGAMTTGGENNLGKILIEERKRLRNSVQ